MRCALVTANGEIPVAVKVFGRQRWWKDRYDRWKVTKAERSFRAACFLLAKGIGTPDPIAWLERWEGSRLRESYYLCRYEPAPSFRVILSDILWNQRRHEALMDVLRHLAPAIRAMHDAGFMHGDMGNQNILLPRTESGAWLPPQMIDLNRCRIRPGPLGDGERAHDLARIALPGAYMQVFKRIYSGNREPAATLDRLERTARRRFWRHRRYSRWRHPIRYRRNVRAQKRPAYPEPRDIWLWDEETAEPVQALEEREERRQRHRRYSLYVAWKGLRARAGIRQLYGKILAGSYAQPRTMSRRIGVAL
ncbi:MAG TPA: lipopolysaccharide kinase InaA family protein, partial [Candidatus Limnocylindria bacterium]|nr:lipopolysaccharide kinase InaA family protein [Candidatus Limnocylindria bacterium]